MTKEYIYFLGVKKILDRESAAPLEIIPPWLGVNLGLTTNIIIINLFIEKYNKLRPSKIKKKIKGKKQKQRNLR